MQESQSKEIVLSDLSAQAFEGITFFEDQKTDPRNSRP